MGKFSLAGLLRLRRLQEDQAAAELAVARSSARDIAARRAMAHARLASGDAAVATPAELFAIAATRSSSSGMLAELAELQELGRSELEAARARHDAARRAARSIEKLEERHILAVTVDELRVEQRAIDELAAKRRRVEDGVE